MKLTKSLAAVALTMAFISSQADASLVDLGYTVNDNSNVVTDTSRNLEWLQWDVSTGLSITEGLSIYGQQGWSLASNLQVSELMNDVGFGPVTIGRGAGGSFDKNEKTSQITILKYSKEERSAANEFIQMFGNTFTAGGYSCCENDDPLELSQVIFGGDENGNGRFNTATVMDDYHSGNGSHRNGFVAINSESRSVTTSTKRNIYGLALVRDVEVSPVPVPASLPLLALALLSFGFIHRRKLSS